jgi:hypothetical protein
MGFTGSFVVARSRRPLLTLPLFSDESTLRTEHESRECFRMLPARPWGWQTIRVDDLLADGPAWLRALVEATEWPAMIASVFDSDVCEVSGLAPGGATWSAVLGGEAPNPPEVVRRIVEWSSAAGFDADACRVADALVMPKWPFLESVFFELLAAAGLPEEVPDYMEDAGDESLIHPKHKADESRQEGSKLEYDVLAMSRDSSILLRCQSEHDCHILVRLRLDGSYDLEYQERTPSQRFRTRTLSQEKVVAALTGWAAGEVAWRDRFQWLQD